ncbi:hypothetical protein BDZ94DRAFT_942838 [Collybia nuda]|uniref:Uncharacterized protein n=1 Tax=Collybia nuda TaxID=64659 RepID=A0A9P5XYN9_9AGAR|nr:hypothetical protein BDZ94DRAFT_942838 [Collybia nuda]
MENRNEKYITKVILYNIQGPPVNDHINMRCHHKKPHKRYKPLPSWLRARRLALGFRIWAFGALNRVILGSVLRTYFVLDSWAYLNPNRRTLLVFLT